MIIKFIVKNRKIGNWNFRFSHSAACALLPNGEQHATLKLEIENSEIEIYDFRIPLHVLYRIGSNSATLKSKIGNRQL